MRCEKMKFSIYSCEGDYRGIDRENPRWKKTPKGVVDRYLEYVELQYAQDDDTEYIDKYIELYRYFTKICKSVELLAISKTRFIHEDFEYIGIDIANDWWESAFAMQHYKYSFLNENKLIPNEELAKKFLSENEYNEIGDKFEMYYVYRYKK